MSEDPEVTDPRDPYKRADIVAELDRWLDRNPMTDRVLTLAALVQRARDEIVSLRKLTDGDWVWKQITDTRDQALEEAARLCERVPGDPQHGDFFAAAIRALKDKVHD